MIPMRSSVETRFFKESIWIDLDNSPHVLFFAPIMKELETRGFKIVVTARECFQVCELADWLGLTYSRVGRHYGSHKALKALGTVWRALQLSKAVSATKPCMAVSHGSRSQLIAAKALRIPTIVIGDYEHAKGLPFISPDVLVVPEVISSHLNWHSKRVETYPGIKEDVYIPDFVPNDGILTDLGLDVANLIVTIRPPATEAHYHRPESDRLFVDVVNFLGAREDLQMVVLPRNERRQGDLIKSRWPKWYREGKIVIPSKVVDGPNLIWHSDLVISGGGTMNREAAALGVPVYSIFRGALGAVDKYLATIGRLTLITSSDDIETKIRLAPSRRPTALQQRDRTTLVRIADVIERTMSEKGLSSQNSLLSGTSA